MSHIIELWTTPTEAHRLTGEVFLTACGDVASSPQGSARANGSVEGVWIVPSTSADAARDADACAALFVPDLPAGGKRSRLPRRNGAPLAPGMHVLRHGDALEPGGGIGARGRRVWISRVLEAREEPWRPSREDEDLFCARSKARIEPGAPVVRCPACALVYAAAAWQAEPRCHACRFDGRQAPWTPPVDPQPVASLDALLDLAR